MCGSVCIHSMWILNLTQYASMLCKINITLRTSGLGFSSILHLNNFTKLSFITKSKLRVLLYNFRLNKQCPKQRTNWKSEIENFQFKITIKQNTAQYNKKKTIVLLEVGHYSLTIFTGVVRCWRQMPRGGEKIIRYLFPRRLYATLLVVCEETMAAIYLKIEGPSWKAYNYDTGSRCATVVDRYTQVGTSWIIGIWKFYCAIKAC